MNMNDVTELKVRLTFTEELLGSAPNNPKIHEEFIASKSPNPETVEDEVAAVGVDEVVKKEMDVFPRDENDAPFLYDYQIRSFLFSERFLAANTPP